MNNTKNNISSFRFLPRPLKLVVLLAVMMMVMPMAGWGQVSPVTPTTDLNENGTIENSEKHLYLIQTNQFESFYITPKGNNLNTVNLPHASMLWYFLEAENDNGTQYYYIVNNSTNKYMCHGGGTANNPTSRGVTLVQKNADNEERCKFKLVENNPNGTDGFYNILVKGNPTYYAVNKQNGNVSDNNIRLTDNAYVNNINSRWKFIPYDGTLVWPNPTFTVSTDSEKHYYKIRNRKTNTFYVSTNPSTSKVTYSSTVSNDMAWYFKDAPSGGLMKYYYIINPAAEDKYMYFEGNTGTSDQSDAVSIKDINEANTDPDRFLFVIVQAAVVGNNDVPINGYYMIVPKLLIGNLWSSNSLGNNAPTNGSNMGIITGRGANLYSHWSFVETIYPMSCSTPTITYSSETGKITIATTTPDAVIHYTTDGVTDPSASVGEPYSGPFDVSAPVTIKAIATKTGYDPSGVVTVSFDQVATPGFELTDDTKVRLTCATSGARIYYAMGNTQPASVTIDPSNLYSGPIENAAGKFITAVAVNDGLWINSIPLETGQITFPCAKPVITKTSPTTFTITCDYPDNNVTIRYKIGENHGMPDDPTTESGTIYNGTVAFGVGDLPFYVKAIAYASGYSPSAVATQRLTQDLTIDADGFYLIASYDNYETFVSMVNEDAENAAAKYKITADINVSGINPITEPFTGELKSVAKADGTFPVLTGLSHAIFNVVDGGKIYNIMLKGVDITGTGNTGAICNEATGTSRIYNCGILPTATVRDSEGNIIGFDGSSVGTSLGSCGSLVGLLDGTARVINCFSYANITSGGGTGNYVGGLVGNNKQTSSQTDLKTIVVNCMFYGEISTQNCSNFAPVYGNNSINNDAATGINPYDFFRENATFDDALPEIASYNRSWPAKEEYLTRFEYYRSILNSNRQLMAWWVTGNITDTALIAKWVLDPEIAPYPVLKKWGKYPSIINPDPSRTWDPEANNGVGGWQSRSSADPYRGKSFGTLSVTVSTGDHPDDEGMTGISVIDDKSWPLIITDMDTLNHDYCYYKVQLPYYNEVFGDPSETNHIKRYYGNYTNKVVTGWIITSITDGVEGVTNSMGIDANGMAFDHRFVENWESGYNFADRYCTDKDLYDESNVSKRVFAQGGFFYVPEGVTAITIEAYWGKAVYLHNTGHYLDRVNITAKGGNRTVGDPFSPTGMGTLDNTFQGQDVWDAWHTAVTKLDEATQTGSEQNAKLSLTVYDQAIVLLSNYQLKNENGAVGYDIESKWHPYTMMSVDLDMDNEPDYCFEFQFRKLWDRPGIQPIRFDFLPVPELGMAVRHNEKQYTIGIFIPQGHFEITETSYMHTTQFEYDFGGTKIPAPVILNGGHFEQIVVRRGTNQRTTYFIMGGHFRMLRFTPGAHTTPDNTIRTRHCAVNAIGGEYPEFYLSGIYKPDQTVNSDNPHCYTNGGRFGTIAGAGYEAIDGDITFKIDHSIIDEFYGGGINKAKPVTGSIDVTIDHSIVGKYCGGPKVGEMSSGKTVTTYAVGTIFTKFYGGGNGGTSYYRKQGYDGNSFDVPTPSDSAGWANFGGAQGYTNYDRFNPLNTRTGSDPLVAVYDNTIGYHALYEFECFVSSNGLAEQPTLRTYTHWAQFGKTSTGNITTFLDDCTVKKSFYGGGNLGNVNGTVTSTLKDCTIMEDVFGGGYSSKIEPFRIHDKSQTHFPYIDGAGVMQDGSNGINSCEYLKNEDGTDRYYTWSHASGHDTDNPTFLGDDGKWYVYTTESLEGLGAVSSNVELTLKGNTTVGHSEGNNLIGGNVYGGGDMSAVNGSTTVKLQGSAHVLGNVYGGGNNGAVGGSSKVEIQDPQP